MKVEGIQTLGGCEVNARQRDMGNFGLVLVKHENGALVYYLLHFPPDFILFLHLAQLFMQPLLMCMNQGMDLWQEPKPKDKVR